MRRFVQAFGELGELPRAWSRELRERLGAAEANYNIGKGDDAWVVANMDGALHLLRMRWGLVPAWSKAPCTRYNTLTARLRRAPRSRLFAAAWRSRRCVVPMSGYYKWDRGRSPAVPHFIQQATDQPLCVAGLWESWTGADGAWLLSFAMLTRETRAIPPPLTPDGPVFLSARAARLWLGASPLLGRAALHLGRAPTLVSWPVSPACKDRARNSHMLIEPAAASEYLRSDPVGDDDGDFEG